jgi:large exoprotein involved in heme utilization and adhesion
MDGDGNLDDPTAGAGGDILVSVQNLRVLDGATISSSTGFADSLAAAGGTVTVQGLEGLGSKAGSVLLSGQSTGIVSVSESGAPGDLTVNARTLTITNGAEISAGNGLSGPAGKVTVEADSIVISAEGRISSQSFSQDAGQVAITANKFTLDSGSIVTSTSSENQGRGGAVVVNSGILSLTNGASINSQSEIFSNGRAGDISITGGSLTLANHAEITSSSTGIGDSAGDAGNVAITASGAFTSNASTIATSAEKARGGNILMDAQNVQLSNGTLISASSNAPFSEDGAGNAGNITITSASNITMQNSLVTTDARHASGGDVEINASNAGMVHLVNSNIITSVHGPKGTSGGNISIDPQFVILQNSQILAQAFAGNGGNINIISRVFLADPNSLVDATSERGISGTVDVRAPVQNVSGELVVLSQDFSSAAALLGQQCAARVADGKFSTFVVAVREGLPVEPGGFLPSPSSLSELGGPVLSGQPRLAPHSIGQSLLPEYDAKPLQLAQFGSACHW